jgi:hypothetical protein
LFNTILLDVTIFFAIRKAAVKIRNVEEGTLLHYQYDGSKFEVCPTEKIGEDNIFLYFKTETKVSPYFAVAGAAVSTPWWFALVIIAVTTLLTVIGIYVYRRFKLTHLRNLVRAWYGKQR